MYVHMNGSRIYSTYYSDQYIHCFHCYFVKGSLLCLHYTLVTSYAQNNVSIKGYLHLCHYVTFCFHVCIHISGFILHWSRNRCGVNSGGVDCNCDKKGQLI